MDIFGTLENFVTGASSFCSTNLENEDSLSGCAILISKYPTKHIARARKGGVHHHKKIQIFPVTAYFIWDQAQDYCCQKKEK
jgi:hypothetical protein